MTIFYQAHFRPELSQKAHCRRKEPVFRVEKNETLYISTFSYMRLYTPTAHQRAILTIPSPYPCGIKRSMNASKQKIKSRS